jgi:outer membrane protein, multidrug efflux system
MRRVAQANIRAQDQTRALTRDRVQTGLATELDVTRAQAQVATTRAQIPRLTSAMKRAVHRLSVLVGVSPGKLAAATARTGVATADLFPRFSLTGAVGLRSVAASDFFTGGSRFFQRRPHPRQHRRPGFKAAAGAPRLPPDGARARRGRKRARHAS